jgi:hypothetical protein
MPQYPEQATIRRKAYRQSRWRRASARLDALKPGAFHSSAVVGGARPRFVLDRDERQRDSEPPKRQAGLVSCQPVAVSFLSCEIFRLRPLLIASSFNWGFRCGWVSP